MDIKDKISKLLALASSPNENEAKAALLKAKELMAKHKLSDLDFQDLKKQELESITMNNVKWTTDSGNIWMTDLCKLICDEYLCSASWVTSYGSRTHTLRITGMGEDLEICRITVEYAMDFVKKAMKLLERRSSASDPRSASQSYAKGFISGLKLAFDQQKQDHPEWGLMVVKPDEVRKYEESLGTKNVRTKQAGFDPLAYLLGQQEGADFNIQRVLEG